MCGFSAHCSWRFGNILRQTCPVMSRKQAPNWTEVRRKIVGWQFCFAVIMSELRNFDCDLSLKRKISKIIERSSFNSNTYYNFSPDAHLNITDDFLTPWRIDGPALWFSQLEIIRHKVVHQSGTTKSIFELMSICQDSKNNWLIDNIIPAFIHKIMQTEIAFKSHYN